MSLNDLQTSVAKMILYRHEIASVHNAHNRPSGAHEWVVRFVSRLGPSAVAGYVGQKSNSAARATSDVVAIQFEQFNCVQPPNL
jgi:hypothetical protein